MNTRAVRQVIAFKRHLKVEIWPGQGVLVFSERRVMRLTGEGIEAITPLLDGTRDLSELFRDAPADVSRDQLRRVIETLTEAGLADSRPPEGGTAMEPVIRAVHAYWDAAGVDPASDFSRFPIRVVDLGETMAEPVRTALVAAGLTAVPEQAGTADAAALTIVLCLDYLDPALAGVDAAQRAAGKPWLLAKPHGTQLWLGPVFQPPVGGCWHCLARRLWRHRWAETCRRGMTDLATPAPRPVVAAPSTVTAAAHLLAHEAWKWVAGHRHAGQRKVWTFDTLTLHGEHHAQPVDPGCPMCGCPGLVAARAWRPVRLRPRRTVPDAGGCGHRAVRPEDVYAQYRHLISPATGIVKRIEPHQRGPASLNCYRAGPLGAAVRDLDSLRGTMRAENGGKGSTPAHARTSALCEALERYSGEYRGDEARMRSSLRLLGSDGIHPNDCMLFDEQQYQDATAWNATCSPRHIVFEPFDPDEIMDWTPLWSMTQQRHRFLPTAALYYGAPSAPNRRAVRADSNGNAAGSCLEDAVLQGLLEVVERDAVALWWYNRTPVPGIDLNAFSEPWFEQVREIHRELGREVWALDVTADSSVSTAVALSRRTSGPSEDIIFGFGAHLDPCVALRRALAELNQMMPMLVDAGAGGPYGCDDPDAVRWWRMATVAEHTYLVSDPRLPSRRPTDVPNAASGDLYQDVETVRSRLESRGLEVLILDQTRPDVALPVVKTVVPGMRPIWARFGPGRLFDVPVRLGWLSEPTPYAELNPTPLFL